MIASYNAESILFKVKNENLELSLDKSKFFLHFLKQLIEHITPRKSLGKVVFWWIAICHVKVQ